MAHRYLVGIFGDEEPLLDAVVKVREAGLQIHDCMTPFPVHGLEKVMGLKETRLHTLGFVMGATGTMFALSAMTWIQTSNWPINFGGKPSFALLSFIPITFELTVLFAGVSMTVAYYIRNGLSLFQHDEVYDVRTTDHKFAMVFDMNQYGSDADVDRIKNLLGTLGVEEVYVRETNHRMPSAEEQS